MLLLDSNTKPYKESPDRKVKFEITINTFKTLMFQNTVNVAFSLMTGVIEVAKNNPSLSSTVH